MTNIVKFSTIVLAFISICIFYSANADETNMKSEKISELKIKEIRTERIENAKQLIKGAKKYFSCGGIGMIDLGAKFDLDVIFFSEPSKEFLCTYAIGMCASEIQSSDNLCVCPPPDWKSSGCWDKYTELSRAK